MKNAVCVCCLAVSVLFCGCGGMEGIGVLPEREGGMAIQTRHVIPAKIAVEVREEVDEKEIRKFVEYMNCELIRTNEANRYVVNVPAKYSPEEVLVALRRHPWVKGAEMRGY